MGSDNAWLAKQVRPVLQAQGHEPDEDFLLGFIALMKERVTLLTDFWENGYYFFEPAKEYDEKIVRKKWKPERRQLFVELLSLLVKSETFTTENVKHLVEQFIEDNNLGFGDVLPILRIGISGTTKGPDVFAMLALLGKEEVESRMRKAFDLFDNFVEAKQ